MSALLDRPIERQRQEDLEGAQSLVIEAANAAPNIPSILLFFEPPDSRVGRLPEAMVVDVRAIAPRSKRSFPKLEPWCKRSGYDL